jgi:uncharacterized SAM-binding protein YcdF (DUF218 family)
MSIPHIFGLDFDSGLIPFAALCAVLGLTRFNRWPVYLAAALFAFTLIVAYTPFFAGIARSEIRSDPLPQSADAIVVLSAGLSADGYLSRDGMERLLSGLELVKRGIAPTIVVTREAKMTGQEVFISDTDQHRLSSLAGVSEVINTPVVRNTHDEAVRVAQIAKSRRWNRVVVVTNPFHTRRACATFEKAGLKVTCFPSLTREIGIKHLTVPRDRVNAFGLWLYDTAGTLRYRQKGWL